MKKLITMLFTMAIAISLTAQNNGFNFNKTNNYNQKESKTKSDTIVYFNPFGIDAGLKVNILNSEVKHTVSSYCLQGFYKGEAANSCQEDGGLLNEEMISIILLTEGSEIFFSSVKVSSLDLDGNENEIFSVSPLVLMNNFGIKQ